MKRTPITNIKYISGRRSYATCGDLGTGVGLNKCLDRYEMWLGYPSGKKELVAVFPIEDLMARIADGYQHKDYLWKNENPGVRVMRILNRLSMENRNVA